LKRLVNVYPVVTAVRAYRNPHHTTNLAVAVHEVTQEVGDFGILLSSGFLIKQALGLNIVSASCTIPGAVVAFFAFSAIKGVLGMVLALAASSFLYIALANLFPHPGARGRRSVLKPLYTAPISLHASPYGARLPVSPLASQRAGPDLFTPAENRDDSLSGTECLDA
jgi:hypothetical protein